ncbi:hypothetical protein KUTeg_005003 [Tegillarca granosa]|uniref:Tudor domain-containing protein 1 n=1 Tax=Tegillarca granosa TaxID=220873 RepID=A0ABQ9FIK0_TEGGR|nr:hypothetical protein KUTeg_005003 [Tegillarca granosa]
MLMDYSLLLEDEIFSSLNHHSDSFERWDPQRMDFESSEFNRYDVGPGRNLPRKKFGGGESNEEGITLFVQGIPNEMTEEGLENLFCKAGKVLRVKKMLSKKPEAGNTYGFITMSTVNEATKAMQIMPLLRMQQQHKSPGSSSSAINLSEIDPSVIHNSSPTETTGRGSRFEDLKITIAHGSGSHGAGSRQISAKGASVENAILSLGRGRGRGSLLNMVETNNQSFRGEFPDGIYSHDQHSSDITNYDGRYAYDSMGTYGHGMNMKGYKDHRNYESSYEGGYGRGHHGYRSGGYSGGQYSDYGRDQYRSGPKSYGRGHKMGYERDYYNDHRHNREYRGQFGRGRGREAEQYYYQDYRRPGSYSSYNKARNSRDNIYKGTFNCSRCKTPYCSEECQRRAWPEHKKICKRLSESNKEDKKFEQQFDISFGNDIVDRMKYQVEKVTGDQVEIKPKEVKKQELTSKRCSSESPKKQFESEETEVKTVAISTHELGLVGKIPGSISSQAEETKPKEVSSEQILMEEQRLQSQSPRNGFVFIIEKRQICSHQHKIFFKICWFNMLKDKKNKEKQFNGVKKQQIFEKMKKVLPAQEQPIVTQQNVVSEDVVNVDQLEQLNLPINTEMEMVVTEVEGPDSIWIQDIDSFTAANDLTIKLNEASQTAEPVSDPVIGGLYLSQYSIDNAWYRSVVESISGDHICVCFIDYGNREVTLASGLKKLPKNLAQESLKAVQCYLGNLPSTVSDAELAKTIVISSVESIFKCQQLYRVTVLKKDNTKYAITIKDLNGDDVGKKLIDAGLVMISEVCGPDEIYVQFYSAETVENIHKFPKELTEVCSKITTPLSSPVVGVICAAKYSADGQWYRARIETIPERDVAAVLFIDFGNRENVQFTNLLPLPQQFLRVEVMAVKCYLDDDTNFTLDKQAIAAVKEILVPTLNCGKIYSLVATKKDDKGYGVVMKTSDGFDVMHMMRNRKSTDTPPQNKKPTVESADITAVGQNQIQYASLPLNEEVQVVVTEVVSPAEIWINLLQDVESGAQINSVLTQIISQFSPVKSPVVGGIYAGQFSVDNTWYRARVESLDGKNKVNVVYIDYGNKETISVDHLRELHPDLLVPEAYGIQCCIDGISPPNGDKTWSDAAIKFFKTVAVPSAACRQSYSVTATQKKDNVFSVLLKDASGVDLSQRLVEKEMALNVTAPLSSQSVQESVSESIPQAAKQLPKEIGELDRQSAGYYIIDFGNKEEVEFSMVRPAFVASTRLPAQAMTCALDNVTLPSSGSWSREDTELFTQLILSQPNPQSGYQAQVKRIEGSTVFIDIKIGSGESISELFLQSRTSASQEPAQNQPAPSQNQPAPSQNQPAPSQNQDVVMATSVHRMDLPLGQRVDTVVVTFNNFHSFYLQILANHQIDLRNLMVNIAEHCMLNETPHSPVVGELVCAKYEEVWNRASVIDIVDGYFVVHYIDFGNSESVDSSLIRKLPQAFATVPIQAVHCRLSGVGLESQTEETITSFVASTVNVASKTEAVKKDGTQFEVIMYSNDGININEQLQPLPNSNMPAGGAAASVHPKVTAMTQNTPSSREFDLIITYAVSPEEFYVQLYDQDEDDSWYRAAITQTYQNGTYQVHYFDFGNREIVTADKLRPITPDFLELPIMTIKCRLADYDNDVNIADYLINDGMAQRSGLSEKEDNDNRCLIFKVKRYGSSKMYDTDIVRNKTILLEMKETTSLKLSLEKQVDLLLKPKEVSISLYSFKIFFLGKKGDLTNEYDVNNILINQKINNNEDNCIHKYGTDVFEMKKVFTLVYTCKFIAFLQNCFVIEKKNEQKKLLK